MWWGQAHPAVIMTRGHQTGKLPDKALIITARHSRVITGIMMFCASENKRAITLMTMMMIRMTLGVNDLWVFSLADAWTPLLIGHWLLSSWWRKLNHLLIEDDKEPTHLCYPQWSHRPHNDNTTISEQSAKHHPAVSSCPPLNCQWDIDPGCLNFKQKRKAFPREWFYLNENSFSTIRFQSLAESLFSLNCWADLIIAFICLSNALCSVFVPVLSFLSASWCYEGDKSVI